MRILIVEDNANMRSFLHSLLQDVAEDITDAVDGTDALEKYVSRRPDIVLMDIELPGIDGIETTARIRSLNNTARILMVTNYDEPMLRERSQRAGAEGYFLKSNILDVLDYLGKVRPTIHLN